MDFPTPGTAPADDERTPEERAATLQPMLADPDPRVRKSAAIALGHLKCPAATGSLCRLLGDADEGVRVLACQALARLADPSAVPALVAATHDPSPEVRSGVLWALANVAAHGNLADEGRAALFGPIVVLAFDPDDGVRADAAAVVGSLRDARATDALTVLLEDTCPRVRANACASLALTDDPAGLEALLGALEEDGLEPLVAVSALDGVARRAERGSVEPASGQAARVVGAACRLARTDTGRPAAADCAPDQVGWADVRATAVWALGLTAPLDLAQRPAVQEALEGAVADGDGWCVRYAAESCARIHDDAARDLLRRTAGAWLDDAGAPRADVDPAVAQVVRQALDAFGA